MKKLLNKVLHRIVWHRVIVKSPFFIRKWLTNIYFGIRGFKLTSVEILGQNLFVATDASGNQLYLTRYHRLSRYQNSIFSKLESLQLEYCTKDLEFDEEIVIDIGANIGEYGLYWQTIKSKKVYYFEPDPTEYAALSKNVKGLAQTINKGLWNSNSVLKFYLANENGDSSLIEPPKFVSEIEVEVIQLDSFSIPGSIGLVKIEAEGAEPEIIQGGKKTLSRSKYVSVDVGPERGINANSTLVDVTNSLCQLGFKLIDYNLTRQSLLFKNEVL